MFCTDKSSQLSRTFYAEHLNFNNLTYYYDSCVVTINEIPSSTFDITGEICVPDTAIVTYTGTTSASAEYHLDFASANIISGFISKIDFIARQAGRSDIEFSSASIVRIKFGFYQAISLSSGIKIVKLIIRPKGGKKQQTKQQEIRN